MTDTLRERVARAMKLASDDPSPVRYWYDEADAAIALVLEEAAREAECVVAYGTSQAVMRENIAAAIRALKNPA